MKVIVRNKNEEIDSKIQIHPSFHESIGEFNAFCQYFALLPVSHVLQADESKLNFSWKAKRTVYAICWLIFATIEGAVAIRRLFRLGFSVHYVEVLMFFVLSPARAFIAFRLARNWKKIMKFWRFCEDGFLKYPFKEKGWKLTTKCRIILIILILQTFGSNFFFN